ncbi:hypothetical protein QUF88_14190 [Bacillus sp. DX1.1]|uniref:hypothetical protein n=1 Tax=unclassified Bacillus (in: firmicutes) TaxID=185979 RepID=UPI0025711F26|nr:MULTISPECIES: hypothetical protein [unclassified Bacillus (in: firmicutes)]MDM5154926.1 hypothetical protein [Bacillus sp. DX1.1]WJE83793.1 hypothetical protein QRE67_11685 [Bacillus sp. DX3.1]
MYIFIGISLIVILIIFLLAQKFTPNSVMMTSFKGSGFKKFIIGLTIASTLALSYGIYNAVTYQPPFQDIKIDNTQYTILGDIGELGYFSEQLIKNGQETKLYLASWKELNLKDAHIIINYPSGKKEVWKPSLSLIKSESVKKIKEKFKIQELYQLSSHTFNETGNVILTIKENENTIAKLSIEVH